MNTNIIYLKWSAMNAGGSINKSDDRENGLKMKKAHAQENGSLKCEKTTDLTGSNILPVLANTATATV